jgi:hypothetical protein
MAGFGAELLVAMPRVNSDGVVAWGVRNLIPILLLVIGLGIIASARNGQLSKNALTISNVLLGCGVIAGAAFFYAFADQITSFVFSG